jgi:transcriptional regulator with XRE-family HTH domain
MTQVNLAKPKPKPVNDGQRQLRASGLSLKQIGDVAGVSKPAAAEWLSGKSKPSGERLERLVAAGFVTDAGAFERLPGAPRPAPTPAPPAPADLVADLRPAVPAWTAGVEQLKPPPLPPRAAGPEAPAPYEPSDVDLDAPGAARALVVAQIKRLQADCKRLRAGNASNDEIRKAEDAELKAAERLAKLAGELNPTEEQRLVKSVKWHVIKTAIFKALGPWPDALAAVVDAVEGAEST